MNAVKQLNHESRNGMKKSYGHGGMDSGFDSSSDLSTRAYFEGKWTTLPSTKFERGKRKTCRETPVGRFRYFDRHCKRHPDIYGWQPKTSRIIPKRKPAEYERQELFKRSSRTFLQHETSDIYTTDESLVRAWQFLKSAECSNDQRARLRANASFDNMSLYRNYNVLESPKENPHMLSPPEEIPWMLSPFCSSSEGGSSSGAPNRSTRMTMSSRDQVFPLSPLSATKLLLKYNEDKERILHELYNESPKFEYEVQNHSVDEKSRKHKNVFLNIPSAGSGSESAPKREYTNQKYKVDNGRRKERTPRPSPRNPKTYKVVARVLVRTGRSLKSSQLTHLEKGSVVIVNQLKKRRARIVHPNEEGEYECLGWVSTHSDDNQRLLVPWNDSLPSVE